MRENIEVFAEKNGIDFAEAKKSLLAWYDGYRFSPDSEANPYIAYALLIHAGLDGIEKKLAPPAPTDINLYAAGDDEIKGIKPLPQNFTTAINIARASDFVKAILPERVINTYALRD